MPVSNRVFDNQELNFSAPSKELGHQVAELISNCPPLDPNSIYCNLLQCEHFSATSCAVTTANNKLVGFVSGYLIPSKQVNEKSNTLFIWQVAVDASQRGKNIGQKMMLDILSRDICSSVKYLETTITESNTASAAMFSKLASLLKAPNIEKSVLFDKHAHFLDQHDSEVLFRIGPFTPNLKQ